MVSVGTAGFKYEYWRGAFYPPDLPDKSMLSFYAKEFPALELDYTYYRMPFARTLEAMANKTPDGFEFCVKAHRSMTHEIPDSLSEIRRVFDQFMAAMRPLSEQSRLGAILVQFPWSYRPGPDAFAYVESLPELCAGEPVVVEFRNREWVSEETFALLEKCAVGYCCVDEPRLKSLMPPIAVATSRVAYVRFHGRNAAAWWNAKVVSDRYNYLYTESELLDWVPKITGLAERADKVYVMFNNCHEGKAPINARMMRSLLDSQAVID